MPAVQAQQCFTGAFSFALLIVTTLPHGSYGSFALLQISSALHGSHSRHFVDQASKPVDINFVPFSLDTTCIDTFNDADRSGHEHLLEVAPVMADIPSQIPNGVLCRTLLHPAVYNKSYMSFAKQGLGPILAEKFDEKLRQTCENAYSPEAWAHLQDNYTGNWLQNPIAPIDNVIFGAMGEWLNQERQKSDAETTSWQDFRNPKDDADDSSMLGLLRHISTASITRIMDFGCGDGVELSQIARGLGLSQEDTLGVDVVDYVRPQARGNMTLMLAPRTGYGNALQEHLNDKQLLGTVSIVFSQVTFHHITSPEMRTAALTFMRDCLKADGVLLLAEWDNSAVPIDYSIYFDLAHFLPNLFFGDPAPTTIAMGPLDTEYLSVQGYIDMFGFSGLRFDSDRSRLPWRTRDNNGTELLGPAAAAERSSGRNFLAVFGK